MSAASNASDASTGTTVVRKVGRGAAASNTTASKGKEKDVGAKGAGKRGANKAAVPAVDGPAQGRRVLRKR